MALFNIACCIFGTSNLTFRNSIAKLKIRTEKTKYIVIKITVCTLRQKKNAHPKKKLECTFEKSAVFTNGLLFSEIINQYLCMAIKQQKKKVNNRWIEGESKVLLAKKNTQKFVNLKWVEKQKRTQNTTNWVQRRTMWIQKKKKKTQEKVRNAFIFFCRANKSLADKKHVPKTYLVHLRVRSSGASGILSIIICCDGGFIGAYDSGGVFWPISATYRRRCHVVVCARVVIVGDGIIVGSCVVGSIVCREGCIPLAFHRQLVDLVA